MAVSWTEYELATFTLMRYVTTTLLLPLSCDM